MASVTDVIKFAVSNAVNAANAAAKTVGGTKTTGTTQKTASSGSSGGTTSGVKSQRDKDNETISKTGGTLYYGDGRPAVTNTGKAWQSGVDYSAEAAKYAAMGDWDAVDDVLTRRAAKMQDTGSTGGGKSNLELWKELNDRYGGPSSGKSLADMQAGSEQAYGAGGKYAGSGMQTPSALEPGYGDYMSFEDFLAGTGYDQYTDATQAAIKAAVQNAVNGYRDQIDTTNRDSDELARQAYIAKMMGQKNLDQQMAANGYAGGMADSQRIATETDYQNRLSEIEKQRLATVKELESAITNAQLTGDMQTAQELADYLQQIQGQWMNYVQNQQQMDNQNYWNQQNLDAQNTESARSWALQQIAMGIMPEDETLTAAGISKQAAQQQVALNLGQTGGGTLTQPTQQTVRGATGGGYNNGSLIPSQVMELQKAINERANDGKPPISEDGKWGPETQAAAGGMTADQAWAAYQGQGTGNSRFSGLTYQTMIQNKQYDQADAYLAQFWDTMSSADRTRANIIANKYGPK